MIDDILRAYPAATLDRGRRYAVLGKVTEVKEDARGITAIVNGTERYRVHLPLSAAKGPPRCTCPACDREGYCKHIAAVAWKLSAQRAGAVKGVGGRVGAIPPVFRSVYSVPMLLARVGLYVGRAVPGDAEEYEPLTDWWWSAAHGRHAGDERRRSLMRHILAIAPEVEAALETLRTWQVPPAPAPSGSELLRVHRELARAYETRAKHVEIVGAIPGPLDDRHPGFTLAYDPAAGLLELRENASALLERPRRLAVRLPFDEPGRPILFQDGAFPPHGVVEAWDLFALRELLKALHARTDPAIARLEQELDRPLWERVLDHLARAEVAPAEPREWWFTLTPREGSPLVGLAARARRPAAGPKARWKRERLWCLLNEPASREERAIGRLVSQDGELPVKSVQKDVHFLRLDTPRGYELLRLLGRHRRVTISGDPGAGSEDEAPAVIVAGVLTMTVERVQGGMLVPRFCVDGDPLPVPLTALHGDAGAVFRWCVDRDLIVVVEVPPALRPWLELALRVGDALAFPSAAITRLAGATEALVRDGIVELPRAALGDELPYEPAPVLRVEWRTEADDVEGLVEVMIRVHPRAPFAPAGAGPRLFTFEDEGRRVYVERDPGREVALANDTIDRIDVPGLRWDRGVGEARGVEAALALAGFLGRDDHGLAIEVKAGRPPSLRPMGGQDKIVVRRLGSWLHLEGSFADGIKLTAGELLEAARLAQRYVRASNGVFLELSKATIERLRPVAAAVQLAPPSLAGTAVHEGFGAVLAQAPELFAGAGREDAAALDSYVRRLERDRRVRVPALDHGTLRAYQRAGVAWMLQLATWAPGCVLADDMGLGKTIQTAAVLKARAKLGPALVVAPASVSSNWIAELGRFMPSLAVRWFNEERALDGIGPGDVLVVSYGLLQRESAAFGEIHWATVVVDEAQYVKNTDARRSDAVRRLRRDFAVALTGTPLENHLGELFSIVDIAFPGLLGDEQSFRARFRRPIEGAHDVDRLATLGTLLAPFLLRRTRAEVLEELPPREEITEQLDLSEPERRRYLALRDECAKALRRNGRGRTPSQLRIALLATLTRLRQLACDVRLVDPDYDGPSTKIRRVVELGVQLAAEGNRALVFSQFTRFLSKVKEALLDADLRVAMLTGETPTSDRKAIIDAFQRGEYDVFCVSLLAGGTGLNLTKASYVIHLDPWWNPAVEEQATARAHRMGQTSPVTVYRMVARGTIEEAVLAMHGEKRRLASSVLEGKGSPRQITSGDLLALLEFGG